MKDEAKWVTDRGNGALIETGNRLEYTSSGSTYTQNSYRTWGLNKATYDTNWEITLDVTNNAQPNVPDVSASVGIEIFSTLSKSLYAAAFVSCYSGLPAQRGFESGLVEGSNFFGNSTLPTTGSPGAIRITFNAVTKVLTYFNDADGASGGYVWNQQASYGINGSGGANANTSWGMSTSGEFQICIFGYSEGLNVVSGTVFADNFSAATQTTTLVSRPKNITGTSATFQGSVYPSGLETTAVFQFSTDEQFDQLETSEPQLIPASMVNTLIAQNIAGLVPGTRYFVRSKAVNLAGTFTSNTVEFSTPPFTLAVDATSGSVNINPLLAAYSPGTVVTLTATPPEGAVFLNWSGSISGSQNPITITMDDRKIVTANFSVDIAEAADSPELIYTNGGNSNWFGQVLTTHDGGDAVQSGTINNSQQSWFETTVTGPGQLDFWWKVSSESTDYLEFYIDGFRQPNRISGVVNWTRRTYTLDAGIHTFRWRYIKDSVFAAGSDSGWVDEITWAPQAVSFESWRMSKFTETELRDLSFSGPHGDPDHDGMVNLLEFGLGSLPKDPAGRSLPVTGIELMGGERYLTLTFTKPATPADVDYTVQVCSELSGWLGGPGHTTVMTDNSATLKVRDNTPVGSGNKRFIRLEVASN